MIALVPGRAGVCVCVAFVMTLPYDMCLVLYTFEMHTMLMLKRNFLTHIMFIKHKKLKVLQNTNYVQMAKNKHFKAFSFE